MMRLLLAAAIAGVATLSLHRPAPVQAVERKAVRGAIDRGVAHVKKRLTDAGGATGEVGAVALMGLTLLECGVPKSDKAVQGALKAVRDAGFQETRTYNLSLAVVFLDRYDDAADTPLIESMLVRLVAGQLASGGWSYTCPSISEDEIKRLKAEMDNVRVLKAGGGGRDLKKLPAKGKRKASDLPAEILRQLQAAGRWNGGGAGATGDNSNTQFATLAVWIGRRYGVPTQGALLRIDQRFRTTQGADGGWQYSPTAAPAGSPAVGVAGPGTGSTATMTCAGLLGLAVGHGAALDVKKAKGQQLEKHDASKDSSLKLGLAALGTAVGTPLGWDGLGAKPAAIPPATGKAYYFLWSLERVAMALNLKTVGKKDWYAWGAEVLLANQRPDGSWVGEYGSQGADTCFALLFLIRSNLVGDLTDSIGGLSNERTLRAGGLGGKGLKETTTTAKLAPTDIGGSAKASAGGASGESGGPAKLVAPKARPKARNDAEAAAYKLNDELLTARGARRAAVLKELRDTRGLAYTEALIRAIGELDAEGKKAARVALAERLTRMKAATLREYLKDAEPEVRRAAALAAASKELKDLCPDLIKLLSDQETTVARAAHAALKELSGQDFGPEPRASLSEHRKAVAAWQAWWKKQARE